MYQNEKTISEKEIYKGRVVHLTCDEVELENCLLYTSPSPRDA